MRQTYDGPATTLGLDDAIRIPRKRSGQPGNLPRAAGTAEDDEEDPMLAALLRYLEWPDD